MKNNKFFLGFAFGLLIFVCVAASVTTYDVLNVTDDPYAGGWNGSVAVPTKNAVYDELQNRATLTDLTSATNNLDATKILFGTLPMDRLNGRVDTNNNATLAGNALITGDAGRGVRSTNITATVLGTSSGVPFAATSAQVGGLFSGGSTYLKADGTTGTGGSGGTPTFNNTQFGSDGAQTNIIAGTHITNFAAVQASGGAVALQVSVGNGNTTNLLQIRDETTPQNLFLIQQAGGIFSVSGARFAADIIGTNTFTGRYVKWDVNDNSIVQSNLTTGASNRFDHTGVIIRDGAGNYDYGTNGSRTMSGGQTNGGLSVVGAALITGAVVLTNTLSVGTNTPPYATNQFQVATLNSGKAFSIGTNGNIYMDGSSGTIGLTNDNGSLGARIGTSYGSFVGTSYFSRASLGAVARIVLDDNLYNISTTGIRWSSGSNPLSAIDTGINRNGVGFVEVNNGTTGVYGGLRAANIFASSTITATGSVQVISGASTTPSFAGGTLKADTTTTGNVGGGEDNLISYSIPANALSANGQCVEFDVWGSFAANVNTKELIVYFGATKVADSGAGGLILNGVAWRVHGKVVRTGATTQTATAELTVGGTLLSGVNGSIAFTTAPGETLSGAVTFKCTGTDSGGLPADNNIVQNGMHLKWNPTGN